MRKGPLVQYCFICQKMAPCFGDAPCLRLEGKARVRAYQEGYYAMYNREFREERLLAYWEDIKASEEAALAKAKAKSDAAFLKAQTIAEFRDQKKRTRLEAIKLRREGVERRRQLRIKAKEDKRKHKESIRQEKLAKRELRKQPGYQKPYLLRAKAATAVKVARMKADKEADRRATE